MKYKSGNVFFGVFMTIFGLVFLLLGIVALGYSRIAFWIFLAVCLVFLTAGGVEIIRFILDLGTLKKGKPSTATIVEIKDFSEILPLNNQNLKKVEYSYVSASGNEVRYLAKVPLSVVEKFAESGTVPVLIYKDRAIIDIKSI